MAHKGTIGNPHKGPGGPRALRFSDLGEIPAKPSPGRVWGNIGTPKRFLGIMQTIPILKNPGKPDGGPIPPQSYIFRVPFLGSTRAPGLPGPRSGVGGSKKWCLGSKASKLGNEKPCRIHWSMPQTEPYVASYGPKPCQGWGPKLGVETWFKSGGQIGSNLRLWALPNCVRGLPNQGFRILGNRANSAPNLAPFGGPWGAKGHQSGGSGAMSKAGLLPGASKRHPEAQSTGGGSHGRSNRPQGRRTTGGGQGSQTPG